LLTAVNDSVDTTDHTRARDQARAVQSGFTTILLSDDIIKTNFISRFRSSPRLQGERPQIDS